MEVVAADEPLRARVNNRSTERRSCAVEKLQIGFVRKGWLTAC
jgi:hypothetical protein